MTHVLLPLDQDESGYPPFAQEEVDVTSAGDDLWRLDVAPAFAYGLAAGDVVRAEVDSVGRTWATAVVSSAGNWCARVVPLAGGEQAPIAAQFRALGCSARETQYGLVVIEPAHNVDPNVVLRALHEGAESTKWHFDLGVIPDSL